MKTRLVVTVLLLGMIGAGQPLFACGEKFRVGIRGTRFQRPPAARTAASILIYANPALNLSRALAGVPVDDTLRKAGYRPTTVRSPKEFQTALDRGGWDLVLLDLADSSDCDRPIAGREPAGRPPRSLQRLEGRAGRGEKTAPACPERAGQESIAGRCR